MSRIEVRVYKDSNRVIVKSSEDIADYLKYSIDKIKNKFVQYNEEVVFFNSLQSNISQDIIDNCKIDYDENNNEEIVDITIEHNYDDMIKFIDKIVENIESM